MTVSTTAAQSVAQGNGATVSFAFNFVAASAADISVIYTNASGFQTTLNPSQYTLVINPPAVGQIWGIGGTVTYPTMGSPIANGTSLTIQRIVPLTQVITISDQGDFAPEVIEEGLDTLCFEIQQLAGRTGQIRGTWVSGAQYNYGDIVTDGINGADTQNLYMCAIANTSGVWTTDLAAGDWSIALNIQQLNAVIGTYLPLVGGTMIGAITLAGNPVSALQATPKQYVDTAVSELAPLASPTFTGDPKAPTPTVGDNDTSIATTAFVSTATTANAFSSFTKGVFIPFNYVNGFLPTNIGGTSTTAGVLITAGQGTDSATNTTLIQNAASVTWLVSNGNAINGYQGGTTLPNSSTIHFFCCAGASGVGTFASTSLAPTLPTGYSTYSRRIFSLNTNSSGALIAGTAVELGGGAYQFLFSGAPVLDVNAATPGNSSRTLYALTVPSGIKISPVIRATSNTSGNSYFIITSPDELDVAPAANTGGNYYNFWTASPGYDVGGDLATTSIVKNGLIITNTSGQIGVRQTAAATVAFYIVTQGFQDFRRT